MTRKDWEKIEKVLKECRERRDRYNCDTLNSLIPEVPSAEWMRRRIVFAIADEFGITGEEQRNKFLKQVGVMYP